MAWINDSIEELQKDLEKAKTQKKAFDEMVDGVHKISLGFAQIAAFLKATGSPFDMQIETCERRIKDLEDERLRNQKPEAKAS